MNTNAGQKPESIVYLPSTNRGLVGKYIRNAVFLIAGGIAALCFNSKANEVNYVIKGPKQYSSIDSWNREELMRKGMGEEKYNEYLKLQEKYSNWSKDEEQGIYWLLVAAAIASGVVAANQGFGLINNRYLAKTLNVVDTEKGRINTTNYWFPYGTTTGDLKIDKMINVYAKQTSIDRMLGTGSVTVKGVVYTSAGSHSVGRTIPYIINPIEAKNKILELLPEKAGLELKLRDGAEIPRAKSETATP